VVDEDFGVGAAPGVGRATGFPGRMPVLRDRRDVYPTVFHPGSSVCICGQGLYEPGDRFDDGLPVLGRVVQEIAEQRERLGPVQ
jgi:hypothetical protein